MWRKRLRCERGSQMVEFVASFPFIVFAFLFIWQIALVAYTLVITEAAARDGARAAAVGGDYINAVKKAAYGLEVTKILPESGPDLSEDEEVTVEVTAKVPTIDVPFISRLDFSITQEATMPVEMIRAGEEP
jgi:hypothetical protein